MSASDAAPATSTATAAAASTQSHRRYPILKTTLQFAAAIALGLGVASGVQHLMRPATGVTNNPVVAITATVPITPGYQAPQPSIPVNQQVLAPRLSASVIVGGSRFDSPEQLALPTDSVFELSLGSNHSGEAQVYAINPEGQASHIWSGHLQAGQDQRTPKLRLEGMRGLETLRIVFKADHTPTGQSAAAVVKHIRLLHV
jgi:hypothetical protein